MAKYPNKVVTNRRSPSNESAYRQAYGDLNPSARRRDHYDISAVRAKDGTPGHALLPQSINRSKDRDNHVRPDIPLNPRRERIRPNQHRRSPAAGCTL